MGGVLCNFIKFNIFFFSFNILAIDGEPVFIESKFGTKQLLYNDHTFNRHVTRDDITYWRCSQFPVFRCRARVKSSSNYLTILNPVHNHEIIKEIRKYGSLKDIKRRFYQNEKTTAVKGGTQRDPLIGAEKIKILNAEVANSKLKN